MPLGPIGQEFWPEYNVDVFARKFIDSIFKSSKKEMEKSLGPWLKKKTSLGPTSQEIWPKYNFGIFAWKLVDSIYSGC